MVVAGSKTTKLGSNVSVGQSSCLDERTIANALKEELIIRFLTQVSSAFSCISELMKSKVQELAEEKLDDTIRGEASASWNRGRALRANSEAASNS